MQQLGPFWLDLKTENDQATNALTVSLDTLNAFIAEGPTEKQLLDVKTNIINGHPMLLASNASQLGFIGNMGFYQMPLERLTRFLLDVSDTRLDTVKNAWQKRFNPAENHDGTTSWLIITLGPEKPE